MSQSNQTSQVLTHLGAISTQEFLRDYWQKKPLLIRNALQNFESLISAEELAGLSLEEDVRSRIIVQNKPNDLDFRVLHGPIQESVYSQLPEEFWTLLVQNCDSLHPGINELLNQFRFIPNWRLDDIMISYATNGGGVGPHFDYYDVILIQAEGRRRWRVGQTCDNNSPLVPDQEMKVLQNFDTQEDYIVEPGDLLYLPARVAHSGEAIGDCVTYSIGFRAPSQADFILDFAQEAASHLNEDQRYTDTNLHQHKNAGEISENNIAYFQNILKDLSENTTEIAHWLAEYSTRNSNIALNNSDEYFYEPIGVEELESDQPFRLSSAHRACYFNPHENGQAQSTLYINGYCWQCSQPLAKKLSEYQTIIYGELSEPDQNLCKKLASNNLLDAV